MRFGVWPAKFSLPVLFCFSIIVCSKELTIAPDVEYVAGSEDGVVFIYIEDARNKTDWWKLEIPVEELLTGAETDDPVLWLDRTQVILHNHSATGEPLSTREVQSTLRFLEQGFSGSPKLSNKTTVHFINNYLAGKRFIADQFDQPYSLHLNGFDFTAEGSIGLNFRDNHGNDYEYYLEPKSGSVIKKKNNLALEQTGTQLHPVSDFWRLVMAECSGADVWSCLNRAREQQTSYDVHRRRLVSRQAQEPSGIPTAGNSTATPSDWKMSDQTAMIILGSIAAAYFSATAAICSVIVWFCIRNSASFNSPAAGASEPTPSPAAVLHTHRHNPDARPGKSNLRRSQGVMLGSGGGSLGAAVIAPVPAVVAAPVSVAVNAPIVRGETLYPVRSSRRNSARVTQPDRQPCSAMAAEYSHGGLEMEERKAGEMGKEDHPDKPRKVRIEEPTEPEVPVTAPIILYPVKSSRPRKIRIGEEPTESEV